MRKRRAKRIFGVLTPAQKRSIARTRKQIAQELPDLLRRNQMMVTARKEKSFSGELRRAIHESKWHLFEIARLIDVEPATIADFLTGEKPLDSDVLDRMMKVLGYKLNFVRQKKTG